MPKEALTGDNGIFPDPASAGAKSSEDERTTPPGIAPGSSRIDYSLGVSRDPRDYFSPRPEDPPELADIRSRLLEAKANFSSDKNLKVSFGQKLKTATIVTAIVYEKDNGKVVSKETKIAAVDASSIDMGLIKISKKQFLVVFVNQENVFEKDL